MKKISAFLVFVLSCYAAQKTGNFGYGGIHMMAGYPMVGIGLRAQSGINGYDFSGSVFPYFIRFSDLAYHVKGLYLFHPRGKRVYLGAGLGLLNEPETIHRVSGSYEGSFGLEWTTRNGNVFFIEADVIAPWRKATLRVHKENGEVLRQVQKVWPGAAFGFGF